ncbi:hypothetical protein MRB53_014763 [Persea americana]|uniref:Uncharacterized protein n=1 Tax=Persea americana TaxID=3435 RepID=A0ACC2KC35_PERAE|nr:hypothetical protein MRB53_014763 [Persea americana]
MVDAGGSRNDVDRDFNHRWSQTHTSFNYTRVHTVFIILDEFSALLPLPLDDELKLHRIVLCTRSCRWGDKSMQPYTFASPKSKSTS